MGLSVTNNSLIHKIFSGLAYSNIFIAAEALSMALITIIISGYKLRPEPLLIPFASFFLIYSMDRYLGIDEDESNMPIRTGFIRKYGAFFFVLSIICYLAALILSLGKNNLALGYTILPVFLALVYSPVNLKRFLFLGNSIVGVAWGTVPLFVGAYYGEIFTTEILFLSGFFTLSWFRNATLFDIKDIEGDLEEGVKTIPNQYGVTKTKFFAMIINLLLAVSWISLITKEMLGYGFLILSALHIYMYLYTKLLDEEQGELFYSLIIDSEYKFLGLIVIIASLIGII